MKLQLNRNSLFISKMHACITLNVKIREVLIGYFVIFKTREKVYNNVLKNLSILTKGANVFQMRPRRTVAACKVIVSVTFESQEIRLLKGYFIVSFFYDWNENYFATLSFFLGALHYNVSLRCLGKYFLCGISPCLGYIKQFSKISGLRTRLWWV